MIYLFNLISHRGWESEHLREPGNATFSFGAETLRAKEEVQIHMEKKRILYPSFIPQACSEQRHFAAPLGLSPRESWARKFAELEGGRHRSIGGFNRIRSV